MNTTTLFPGNQAHHQVSQATTFIATTRSSQPFLGQAQALLMTMTNLSTPQQFMELGLLMPTEM